jgi:hypothetical protein
LLILSKEGISFEEIEIPVDQLMSVYDAMTKNRGTKITAINFFLLTKFSITEDISPVLLNFLFPCCWKRNIK